MGAAETVVAAVKAVTGLVGTVVVVTVVPFGSGIAAVTLFTEADVGAGTDFARVVTVTVLAWADVVSETIFTVFVVMGFAVAGEEAVANLVETVVGLGVVAVTVLEGAGVVVTAVRVDVAAGCLQAIEVNGVRGCFTAAVVGSVDTSFTAVLLAAVETDFTSLSVGGERVVLESVVSTTVLGAGTDVGGTFTTAVDGTAMEGMVVVVAEAGVTTVAVVLGAGAGDVVTAVEAVSVDFTGALEGAGAGFPAETVVETAMVAGVREVVDLMAMD